MDSSTFSSLDLDHFLRFKCEWFTNADDQMEFGDQLVSLHKFVKNGDFQVANNLLGKIKLTVDRLLTPSELMEKSNERLQEVFVYYEQLLELLKYVNNPQEQLEILLKMISSPAFIEHKLKDMFTWMIIQNLVNVIYDHGSQFSEKVWVVIEICNWQWLFAQEKIDIVLFYIFVCWMNPRDIERYKTILSSNLTEYSSIDDIIIESQWWKEEDIWCAQQIRSSLNNPEVLPSLRSY